MRELLESSDPRAAFALDYFVYRVDAPRRHAGGCPAGLDAFVFTAGIGENSAAMRARIAERLAWLGRGARSGGQRNGTRRGSRAQDSRVPVYIVPTDEELMIAQHTLSLLWSRNSSASPKPRESVMTIPVFPETKVALKGKGLIVGIANDQSIAWGCAKAFRALGAELAVTYLNDKAKKYVEPLARELEAPIFMPLDVSYRGADRGGVRAHREGMGPARFPRPLDRLLAQGGAARPRGRRRRATASSRPWTSRAGRSCAWRIWPSR